MSRQKIAAAVFTGGVLFAATVSAQMPERAGPTAPGGKTVSPQESAPSQKAAPAAGEKMPAPSPNAADKETVPSPEGEAQAPAPGTEEAAPAGEEETGETTAEETAPSEDFDSRFEGYGRRPEKRFAPPSKGLYGLSPSQFLKNRRAGRLSAFPDDQLDCENPQSEAEKKACAEKKEQAGEAGELPEDEVEEKEKAAAQEDKGRPKSLDEYRREQIFNHHASLPGMNQEETKKYLRDEPDERGNWIKKDYFPEDVALPGWNPPKDGKKHGVDMDSMVTMMQSLKKFGTGIEMPDVEKKMRENPQEAGRILWGAMMEMEVDPDMDPKTIVPQTLKNIEEVSGFKYQELLQQSRENLNSLGLDENVP